MPYWAAFSLGFLFSFAHCLGMCGGIVAAYSANLPRDRMAWVPHLLYNLGRTLSYTGIGAGVGALGSIVALGGKLTGFQNALSIIVGVLMISMGLGMLGWKLLRLDLPSLAGTSWFRRLFQSALRLPPALKTFGVGILNGWLPCGMVYSGATLAAGTGSPIGGAITMACFGLGTMPAMFLLGAIAYQLGVEARQRLQQLGALAMIVVGGMILWRGV